MTGLVVVSSMMRDPAAFVGVGDDAMTRLAFANLPGGQYVLTLALSVFAFTTILGWSFYGEKVCGVPVRRAGDHGVPGGLSGGAVFGHGDEPGPGVWNFSDLMNGLMAFPNLVSVLLLSGVIVKETRHYLWEGRLDEASGETV